MKGPFGCSSSDGRLNCRGTPAAARQRTADSADGACVSVRAAAGVRFFDPDASREVLRVQTGQTPPAAAGQVPSGDRAGAVGLGRPVVAPGSQRRGDTMFTAMSAVLTSLVAAVIATATHVVSFAAFTVGGVPTVHIAHTVRGSCFTESLAADRDDAYRCLSGNVIYDPCFAPPAAVHAAKGIVVCPQAPWADSGIEIRLTKALPRNTLRTPSIGGVPWAIETTTGCRSVIATGATAAIGTRRANYYCAGTKQWLWGTPSRTSEPWMIFTAPLNATRLSRRVAVEQAWY
jgi:hypothetical protein